MRDEIILILILNKNINNNNNNNYYNNKKKKKKNNYVCMCLKDHFTSWRCPFILVSKNAKYCKS